MAMLQVKIFLEKFFVLKLLLNLLFDNIVRIDIVSSATSPNTDSNPAIFFPVNLKRESNSSHVDVMF
jgi:hypothetical protein